MVEEARTGGTGKGLGRGLSALLGDDVARPASPERSGEAPRSARELPIEQIRPSPFQPRRVFDETALEQLTHSIRDKGVIEPLIVRRTGTDSYEIIAGERRWRAAQRAQLHTVPVVLKDLTDAQVLEVALIENLQREDLRPLEEAEGYSRLLEQFAYTQEQLADAVGKSRSHVTNMLRLLGLPAPIKTMLDSGALTAGHARPLLGLSDPLPAARKIADRKMSVRQAEDLVRRLSESPRRKAKTRKSKGAAAAAPAEARPATAKDADTIALENDLTAALGLPVSITFDPAEGGTLTIHYTTLDQLDELIGKLAG
ncbi:MAG: ParB/RepB/Spo0J family partition protein [Alphaproteobacteria bacterium]|nr:ParB/RepB/Spo0J family partition protein [Alphaproteobacteria bacterium]